MMTSAGLVTAYSRVASANRRGMARPQAYALHKLDAEKRRAETAARFETKIHHSNVQTARSASCQLAM